MSDKNSTDEPMIGIFWAIPLADVAANAWELATFAEPASCVPTVGGFKTTDPGHDQVWKRQVIRKRPDLRGYGYEHFPRGRINYIAAEDCYLILADAFFMARAWQEQIVTRFALEKVSHKIVGDAHYVTSYSRKSLG